MIRNKLIRVATTVWSVTCIARDLWQGLSAGSLHWTCESCGRIVGREFPEELVRVHDALVCRTCAGSLDAELVDKDPPQPVIEWEGRGLGLRASGDSWIARVELEGQSWRWGVWRYDNDVESADIDECSEGRTRLGEDEAKRRAAEALATMLEQP